MCSTMLNSMKSMDLMQHFPNWEAQTSLKGGASINHSHLNIVMYGKVSLVMKVLC